jgi:hypothetical protein
MGKCSPFVAGDSLTSMQCSPDNGPLATCCPTMCVSLHWFTKCQNASQFKRFCVGRIAFVYWLATVKGRGLALDDASIAMQHVAYMYGTGGTTRLNLFSLYCLFWIGQ